MNETGKNIQEEKAKIPYRLSEISDPPKRLYKRGTLPNEDWRHLTVVGSRKHTSYGKRICESLIQSLRGYPIVVVSGLALGIDSIAHEAALDAGLPTIAVPGSGLSDAVLYPATNLNLAHRIIQNGGCLLSEFEPDFRATNWSFPKRNRIMAGLADAILVIEAEEKSGTRITARLATEYNRDVFTVPGPIDSPQSTGTNALLREGATPVTCAGDIIQAFGLTAVSDESIDRYADCSDEEKMVLEILIQPQSRDKILRRIDLSTHKANILLSSMEIKGLIGESLGKVHRV